MLKFYGSLGEEPINTEDSFFRAWNDAHGFYAVSADFVCNRDAIACVQFEQRYIGIAFERDENFCRVFGSPASFFMKFKKGDPVSYDMMILQEDFFTENKIKFYDSFWRDVSKNLEGSQMYVPELTTVFQEIKKIPMDASKEGNRRLTACGLAAAVYLMEKINLQNQGGPVQLDEFENHAVVLAKEMIKQDLQNVPTISELCRHAGVNKNKLQAGFRITTGESIGEYVRTLRMTRALNLMEEDNLPINEIAYRVGYYGVSSFYQAFRQVFGETPMTIRTMLREQKS